ncbi:MBL fold metallo-hydrolase (plasmid) [Arthrobacter sp. zg-Y820]|uniref:MBL fold metallo-hydrolase n=1 Tax=unclassified Arthrobacter TaxID=235627 RepID=UPI001E537CA4|nr:MULTISPECIES: MBL fold metallo-hydrolase [unclassified Arthrobacter]MCC9198523.1 MBL fold metallo-hydrolase [Arthrobacter sp. zg-Y820]MDK1281393.1 MBL fold metallo-hydrolase [Arthrobacter sp. zg.Y820]WIB11260.1 MBL fold metallo-hydrolase [Arthrobacter sp. zg-Y820]
MAALQLSKYVWLVGGSTAGPTFTSQYDCNQYLLWDGSRGVLVDAGSGLAAAQWLHNVADVVDPAQLDGVLITHYHGDHAGGVSAAQKAGLRVWGSSVCSLALAAGDEERTQVRRARDVGVYPPHFTLPPAAGVQTLANGSLTVGTLVLEVYDTPGHCDGHLVFGVKENDGVSLFTGDVLFAGGRISMQAIPDCRLDLYGQSIARLADVPVIALYPGHSDADLSPDSARRAVISAAESFARLVPPLNFLS